MFFCSKKTLAAMIEAVKKALIDDEVSRMPQVFRQMFANGRSIGEIRVMVAERESQWAKAAEADRKKADANRLHFDQILELVSKIQIDFPK